MARGANGTGTGGLLPTVGWLAAALLPPGAAAGFWRDLVARHWLIAAGLLAVYWVLVAGVRFAGEIAGDLTKEYRPRLVRRIVKMLDQRFSRFARRYREYVMGSLRFIDQKGLATVGFYTPELDEVFVDVGLAYRAPGQARGDLLADLPAGVTDRRSLGELLDRPDPVALAVIGAPGSGKTTLLRFTAREVCKARSGRRRTVPASHSITAVAVLRHLNASVPDLIPASSVCHSARSKASTGPEGFFESRTAINRPTLATSMRSPSLVSLWVLLRRREATSRQLPSSPPLWLLFRQTEATSTHSPSLAPL
jgi:hypothetical protein